VEKTGKHVAEAAPVAPDVMGHSEREALRAEMASAPHFASPWSSAAAAPADVTRDDEQAWILTYLDMLTLVLVLFVVLLAYTGPEQDEGLAWTQGSLIDFVNYQNPTIAPLLSNMPGGMRGNTPVQLPIPELPGAEPAPTAELHIDGVEVHSLPGRVELRIRDGVLFRVASADLHADGERLLDRLVPLLSRVPGRIVVEGHTDNVPIDNEIFPSNWELSAARASVVVRYLIRRGVLPQRLQASGFADTQPLADNESPAGRAANRRVALVVHSESLQSAPVD